MELGRNNRRHFLKSITFGSAALSGTSLKDLFGTESSAAANNKPASVVNNHCGMIKYFDKGSPLTISMWDYSWLKGHYPGGRFENLEKCVEQAAQRGYNTLRIDCFPSHILEGTSTFKAGYGFSAVIPHWGDSTVTHEENVLKKVAELAGYCRKNNIWLGLDSWKKNHMMGHDRMIGPSEEEENFTKFSQTWVKALKLMRNEGVLERAVWIAPMNEVPFFVEKRLESLIEIRKTYKSAAEIESAANPVYKRINHWMGEAIKEEIRKDHIPLSYSSNAIEPFGKRLTDIYDVVDVHYMPEVITDAKSDAVFVQSYNGHKKSYLFGDMEKYNLKLWSQAWAMACRNNYRQMLARNLAYFSGVFSMLTTESGKALVPIVTESFGPCFFPDHPDVDWTWYKHYNGDSARLLATMPYAGTSLSNYAEPFFTLWDDADWHRNTNLYITALTQ